MLNIILFLLLSLNININALNYLFNNLDQLEESSFETQIDKLIDSLQKKRVEQEELVATYKKTFQKSQANLNLLKNKAKTYKGKELAFVNKLILIEGQYIQTLSEIDQVQEQIINSLNTHIKIFQDQKLDPEFKNKNIHIPEKSIYSIEDLEKVYDLIVGFEVNIKKSQDRLKKIYLDLDNRKKSLDLLNQEYEDKKKEQKELKNVSNSDEKVQNLEFNTQQTGELLDSQANLLKLKVDLIKLRIQEIEHKASLIDAQIKIDQLQLKLVNKEYFKIKSSLVIDQKYIEKSDANLKNRLQDYTRKQTELNKKIDQLNDLKSKELSDINSTKKKFNISDSDYEAIINWTYKPKTISEWEAFIAIARLYDQIKYEIDTSKEYLLSQVDHEKAIMNELEVKNLIAHTWYKLTQRKGLDTQDELNKEIKQYEKIKANVQSMMSSTGDKKVTTSSLLNENIKISESIKAIFQDFKLLKNTLYKDHLNDFNKNLLAIRDEFSENNARRSETLNQSVELLNNTSLILERIQNKIDGILKELNNKIQWGSLPPIWKSLHNFVPDIKNFVNYLFNVNYFKKLSDIKDNIFNNIYYYFTHIFDLLSLLIQLLMLVLLYLLLYLFIPDLIKFFTPYGAEFGSTINRGWNVTISSFISIVLNFIHNNLFPIFTWFALFIGMYYNFINDNLLGILFYLVSIPFWLYYSYKFIAWFKSQNKAYNYLFSGKEYENKFFMILSILLYSSVIILLFREAFSIYSLQKNDVSSVLMAINYMLFQVAMISLLNKDQVLSLLPRDSDFGKWFYGIVKKYYYLFFASIFLLIILSNPYIGYGAQFFWFVSRVILILLLIPFMIAVHIQIKRLLLGFFLSNAEESAKEKFVNNRTIFGILVILNFLFLTVLYFILAANIWGYNIGLTKIFEWLQTSLYSYTDTETGQVVIVDFFRVGKAIIYVLFGFVLSYFINKYILGYIFDLLLINTGLQNAILNLVKYSLIFASVIISLKSIGLGSSLLYLFAIIGGLGVAGKEVITDFIAYFIILIQRPLKIGDYVRIDTDSEGVVRHITLRSVLIRHKNSTTVIVPNSSVINKSLTNWSYSRTFIAFPDIVLAVPYSANPAFVKKLMFQVLDLNVNVLKNPAPIIRLVDFIDNGYQFMIRGFLSPDKVLDQFDIASDIRLEIVSMLSEHNIKIASPTRLVVLENVLKSDMTGK